MRHCKDILPGHLPRNSEEKAWFQFYGWNDLMFQVLRRRDALYCHLFGSLDEDFFCIEKECAAVSKEYLQGSCFWFVRWCLCSMPRNVW
ncbi:uncharacterized protein NMK_1821 [Novimethylophilus kurashikiensis]|uniref:Uncharacterized protein n=1 Tax=Novimethylophilus kurashikiensis TaxID=1825523 RepID=A0A2R5F7R4_9PROT|nr:uncharacterized protein NMK_1821 [Novimethylophilus kurashikiensis]